MTFSKPVSLTNLACFYSSPNIAYLVSERCVESINDLMCDLNDYLCYNVFCPPNNSILNAIIQGYFYSKLADHHIF